MAARLAADCSPAVAVQVVPTACKSGTATAAVAPIPGATYAWTVTGGQIAGSAAADHITIALGTGDTATASVTVTEGICVAHGSGVIALRNPFAVHAIIPEAHAGEPLTILWAYEGGTPARQTINGSDFGLLTLPPEARSYTYTPDTSGNRQIVIEAAMQTPPGTAPAPIGRRRSVGKSFATASTCTSAQTTATYTVGECVKPPLTLNAPDSVLTGSTFQLNVVPQPGAVATWTINNGTPSTATGNSVTVTAGASGRVDVGVRLTRGACATQLDRSIEITQQLVCNNPKAVVSAGAVSCGAGKINVTFTGNPPFHGVWSDNDSFTTNATTLVRTVSAPGNYSITRFEDATCVGTASGVASFTALGPTATITGNANSCLGRESVTVTFTGKPPFSGRWTDDSDFVTNEMQITKPINAAGPNTLLYGYDGTDCRLTVFGGVTGRPTQTVRAGLFCLAPDFENVVGLYAQFLGDYTPPLSVTWSDGVTTTDSGNPVYRFVKPAETTTYTIVSAHDAYCTSTVVAPSSATVYGGPVPDFTLGVGDMCAGQNFTAKLDTPPPAGVEVKWFIENGTILSGQGTSTMQFKSGDVGTMTVGCTFVFPDPNRCPTSHRNAVRIDADPKITLSLPVAQIQAGKTADVLFTVDNAVHYWTLENTMDDSLQLVGLCGNGFQCHATYTSSHGPGTSTITLRATGFCSNVKELSVKLTIVP